VKGWPDHETDRSVVCRDLASTRQALPFRNRFMVTPAL